MKKDNPKSLKCKRCGYEWEPRLIKRKPKQCPRCKSYDWNKEKIIQ